MGSKGITHKSHSLGLATPLTCYASILVQQYQLDALSYIFMHLIIDISSQSTVRISKREFLEKNSHSLNFSIIKVTRHIPNLVIMRSLDKHKYAEKRVSINRSCWKFWVENQSEVWTGYQQPGTCTLHSHLHAGGAIIHKGNKLATWSTHLILAGTFEFLLLNPFKLENNRTLEKVHEWKELC